MDHEVTFVRVSLCKIDLIPLAGFAEVDNVSQILFRRRCDIAVRRSRRVQLQIFFVLHLSNLRFGFAALLDPFLDILHGRQLLFQIIRQATGNFVFAHANRLGNVLERVFRHHIVLALAQEQTNGWVILLFL